MQILLDGLGRPQVHGTRILAELFARPPLAQEIVVPIELDLNLIETLLFGGSERSLRGKIEEPMLFGDELFNVSP